MGLLSFLWASKALEEVRYLEHRVRVLESQISRLENELLALKTKVVNG